MAKYFDDVRLRLSKLTKNKHFSHGFPFIIFIVGGSFVLEQFARVRYEFRKTNPFDLRDDSNCEVTKVKPEEEYEKLEKMNLNEWDSKRISRPWEPEEKKSA